MTRTGKKRDERMIAAAQATADRVAWLLEFANKDLGMLSPDEKDALRWEISSFAYPPHSGSNLWRPHHRDAVTRMDPRIARMIAPAFPFPDLDVADLHKGLRWAMRSLVDGGGTLRQFPSGGGLYGVGRCQDGTFEVVIGGGPDLLFFGRVFQLLASLGSRLRSCPAAGCDRFFGAKRRQTYCSDRCASRVRIQRFRAAHPGKLGAIKRASYVRKRQRKLGTNVRVRRLARSRKTHGTERSEPR